MSERYLAGENTLEFDRSIFDEDQLMILDQGIDLGIRMDQAEVYTHPKFSWRQMYEMQQGFVNGLSISQVQSFADASLSFEEMHKKRLHEEAVIGFKEDEELLANDRPTNELLEMMKQNGMEKESEEYLKVLMQVDALQNHINKQDQVIYNLEKEVKNLHTPSIKERALDVLEAVKRDFNIFKERLNQLRERMKEGSVLLLNTFKTYGEIAFYKSFEVFSHGIKNVFQELDNNNSAQLEKTEKHLEKLVGIREELSSVRLHLKNAGRMLVGRKPLSVEENKRTVAVLQMAIGNLRNQRRNSQRQHSIYQYCIKKMDLLEKSFGEKTKEKKQDLNSMISEAAAEKKSQEHTRTNQREQDKGRV